jgi:hypothetical protein
VDGRYRPDRPRDPIANPSELLGLWWQNLELDDLELATITFSHQVDRSGERVPLKTDESKATLPLPRSTALMLLEHRARSVHAGPRAFVFSTRSGRPLGQRNVLRALYRAQERARDAQGLPTFPDLFEHDEHGHLAVDAEGRYMLRGLPRKELPPLPDFHALRHTAAMDYEDAEEARDLLRHRNSNVTRSVYPGALRRPPPRSAACPYGSAHGSGRARQSAAGVRVVACLSGRFTGDSPGSAVDRNSRAAPHTREVAGSKPAAPIVDSRSGRMRETLGWSGNEREGRAGRAARRQ